MWGVLLQVNECKRNEKGSANPAPSAVIAVTDLSSLFGVQTVITSVQIYSFLCYQICCFVFLGRDGGRGSAAVK